MTHTDRLRAVGLAAVLGIVTVAGCQLDGLGALRGLVTGTPAEPEATGPTLTAPLPDSYSLAQLGKPAPAESKSVPPLPVGPTLVAAGYSPWPTLGEPGVIGDPMTDGQEVAVGPALLGPQWSPWATLGQPVALAESFVVEQKTASARALFSPRARLGLVCDNQEVPPVVVAQSPQVSQPTAPRQPPVCRVSFAADEDREAPRADSVPVVDRVVDPQPVSVPVVPPEVRIVTIDLNEALRHAAAARRLDAAATNNHTLLDVAVAYLDLVGAEAQVAALLQSEHEMAQMVDHVSKWAQAGHGSESEASRAWAWTERLQSVRARAQQEVEVASARLARLLNVGPSVALRSGGSLLPVQLVNPKEDPEGLVQWALANHQELRARTADVTVNQPRLREENLRPWLPLLIVGYSAGGIVGGGDEADIPFGHLQDRHYHDVLALWAMRHVGLSNLALQRAAEARVGEAAAEWPVIASAVRQAVTAAHSLCLARLNDVEVARRRLDAAQEACRLELARVNNLEARPIEMLGSLNLLTAARRDWIGAMVGYNQAQFELYVALGQLTGSVQHASCARP